MGLLFFWFFASLVVAVWASNRGRSGFAWWLLSMLLSVRAKGSAPTIPEAVDLTFRMRYASGMNSTIPSAEEVRERLRGLELAKVRDLAAASGVPFTTLWKMRSGETKNPGIDTVRKVYSQIPPQALANAAQCAINSVAAGAAQGV